jgi:hypothetical protein
MKTIDIIDIVFCFVAMLVAIIDLFTGFLHKDYKSAKKLIRSLYVFLFIFAIQIILKHWK